MKIEIFNKSFKFIKKFCITFLVIININTVFRNPDKYIIFKLSQRT